MCGRYLINEATILKKRYNFTNQLPMFQAKYNIAPGSTMPVIVGGQERTVEFMKWGLVPFWANDPRIGYKMINARAEDIEKKPSFRKPFKSQRCLVPATGFYEWTHQGPIKQPYLIKLKDEPVFSFAGLYDIWNDAENRQLKTYTIITTNANDLVAKLHNRMPVILHREDEERWFDPSTGNPQDLLKPIESAFMEAYPVSTDVNNPRNDSSELTVRITGRN